MITIHVSYCFTCIQFSQKLLKPSRTAAKQGVWSHFLDKVQQVCHFLVFRNFWINIFVTEKNWTFVLIWHTSLTFQLKRLQRNQLLLEKVMLLKPQRKIKLTLRNRVKMFKVKLKRKGMKGYVVFVRCVCSCFHFFFITIKKILY